MHAQRAAPAAWRPVGRRLPRSLGRASFFSGAPIRPPAGPACRARRVGYAPRVARAGHRGRPLAPVPASPPRRPPPPLASPHSVGYRVPRRFRRPRGGPLAHWGPRSSTSRIVYKQATIGSAHSYEKVSTACRDMVRALVEHNDHRGHHIMRKPLISRHDFGRNHHIMVLMQTAGLALSE